jgi:RNA-directed DNA polymerase
LKKATPGKYKAIPVRRVIIPKEINPDKIRYLGIPTLYDRAVQALYLLALIPIAEEMADSYSFGFRPLRSAIDALQQVQIFLRDPQYN